MIAVGVLIAFAAAVANAFALVFQAQEARGTSEQEAARFSLLWDLARRPRWLAGTGLLVIAWPLQIVSLSFAPLTVVQPVLATFQLILVVIARFYLRDRVGRTEWLGALAVTAGVTLVIVGAPHRTVAHPDAARVAVPLALIGVAALAAFAVARRRPTRGLVLALGAGLGYAWVDFSDKLVSNAFADGKVLAAAVWLIAVAGFGAIAFVQENTALQRRPAVQVGPVIGAIQEPLPVLMALAGGVEAWAGGIVRLADLAAGLALAGLGAAVLAHSPAVARTSGPGSA
jgi:drug/metabolite transporter (DMT)-like permease